MGRFTKGIFLGGLLGAGLFWLNTSTKGKEVREQILDHAADAYVKFKQELMASKQFKELKKNEYVVLVKKYVDKYAIENGLADNVKKMVEKLLAGQWKNIKNEE